VLKAKAIATRLLNDLRSPDGCRIFSPDDRIAVTPVNLEISFEAEVGFAEYCADLLIKRPFLASLSLSSLGLKTCKTRAIIPRFTSCPRASWSNLGADVLEYIEFARPIEADPIRILGLMTWKNAADRI
jgi:hypothetical protein